MKKIFILPFLLLLFLFPQITYAKEIEVNIDSINLLEKSDTVEIINEPMYSNLNINFDIRFKEINDYVKYEVQLANLNNNVYTIDFQTMFEESDYIKYEIDISEEDKVLPENSTSKFIVTITLVKEIPEELIEDNIFLEKNSLELLLTNIKGDEIFINPRTSNNLEIILGVLIVIFIGLIYMTFDNKKTAMIIIFICSWMIPLHIYAVEQTTVRIETTVFFEKTIPEEPDENANG